MQQPEDESQLFSVGDQVEVESRTWPGINKPGGHGRVMKLNDDGTINVKYVLGGSEKRVELKYVEAVGAQKKEKRDVKSDEVQVTMSACNLVHFQRPLHQGPGARALPLSLSLYVSPSLSRTHIRTTIRLQELDGSTRCILDFIAKIRRKDEYGLFHEPVDRAEVPDYHELVKNPMDLHTLQVKIRYTVPVLNLMSHGFRRTWLWPKRSKR